MAKNLTAFLAQNAKKIDNVTFIASDRFVDPDTGEAMPWEICCITAAENAGLRKACMRTVPVPGRKGQFTQDFDANAYLAKVPSISRTHWWQRCAGSSRTAPTAPTAFSSSARWSRASWRTPSPPTSGIRWRIAAPCAGMWWTR